MLETGAANILNPDVLGVGFVDAHFVGEYERLHPCIRAFACVDIGGRKFTWREALSGNAHHGLLVGEVFFQSCAFLRDCATESTK